MNLNIDLVPGLWYFCTINKFSFKIEDHMIIDIKGVIYKKIKGNEK